MTLHTAQEHPNIPLREHAHELIEKLEAMGVTPSPDDDGEDGEEWVDVDGSESDEDIDMP